jgi:hypothetical protein
VLVMPRGRSLLVGTASELTTRAHAYA